MRVVRSDSPIYALRAVWYGPGGGLKAGRFSVWGFGSALAIAIALAVAMIGLTDNGIVNLLFGVIVGPVMSYVLTPRLAQYVDHWRGFRAWIQIIIAEISAPKGSTEKPRPRQYQIDLGRVQQ